MSQTKSVPSIETASTPARRLSRRALVRWTLRGAILGLLALNAWWLWEERPLPGVKELSRLVDGRRFADAESPLRTLTRRSPHDGDLRMLLARVLAAKGDPRGCAEQLHAVPYWWPSKLDALVREGTAWMEAHRAADAERAWLAYLKDDPNHPVEKPQIGAVENELINLYALEDRWEDARGIVWRSYDRAAGDLARQNLALMVLRTRVERSAPKVALPKMRQFVAADPEDWEARLALAKFAQALNLAAEAGREIKACLEARPKDPRVWRTWIEILNARGDKAALDEALGRVPPEADTEATIWAARARSRLARGDAPGAAAAFRRAAELAPEEVEYPYRLSLLEKQLGHTQEADRWRRRHADLVKASGALTDAINAFLDASEGTAAAKGTTPAAAAKNLADLCRTLGWRREAEAWARLSKTFEAASKAS